MASVGIQCVHYDRVKTRSVCFYRNQKVGIAAVSMLKNYGYKKGRVSMSKDVTSFNKAAFIDSCSSFSSNNSNRSCNPVVYEKMDRWMKESVAEIVKNLRDVPLLVLINGNGKDSAAMLKAEEEEWPEMIGRWESGESPLPEGIIFVEQLDVEEEEEIEGLKLINNNNINNNKKDGVTRAWGVVVQGQGVDCGPICYLLKTSSVCAGGHLGLCSTHFCLTRVRSFRETATTQLRNCWLLQAHQ